MNQYLVDKGGISKEISGVVFDCDGVMINSRKANEEFYNRVLHCFDLPPITKEQEAFTFMSTAKDALEHIVPPQYWHKLAKICEDEVNYKRDIMPLVYLEEGIVDFLDFLQKNDIRMAVHTNRSDTMDGILERFNLQKYFDPVVTSFMVAPKPSPEGIHYILDKWGFVKEQIVFIGDSSNDEHACAAADVFFIAYGKEKLDAQIKVQSYKSLTDLFVNKSTLI